MRYSIRIDGNLKKKIAQLSEKEPFRVKVALQKSVRLLQQKAEREVPVWSGDLKKGHHARVNNMRGVMWNDTSYAVGVHEGRPPHRVKGVNNPNSSFYRWCEDKGLVPFAVAKSIAKKGTRAQPWMKKTFRTSERKIIRIFEREIHKLEKT